MNLKYGINRYQIASCRGNSAASWRNGACDKTSYKSIQQNKKEKIGNLHHTINPDAHKANTSSLKWTVLQMIAFLTFLIAPLKKKSRWNYQ